MCPVWLVTRVNAFSFVWRFVFARGGIMYLFSHVRLGGLFVTEEGRVILKKRVYMSHFGKKLWWRLCELSR